MWAKLQFKVFHDEIISEYGDIVYNWDVIGLAKVRFCYAFCHY
jgi:hypothetical protein